ncbi:MAG: aminodeoxychorismate/anthranilate synthase component II [Candidatus Omnitrophica bacterium]|nr:aminodeoxychorismate/anthranilate synthase component II [Candidatus Omnitrophota bacterium]
MVLVIDNYDSFTYNLVQYLGELGADLEVYRNDMITASEAKRLHPECIIISPGPGSPKDAGVSNAVIHECGPVIPLLGVCLGHQCIGEVFGGRVVQAPRLMHGKTSPIYHNEKTIFTGIANPFDATRYHSLMVEKKTLPASLEIIAKTDTDEIMGLQHRRYPVWGVQFHPESILTVAGKELLANFLAIAVAYHKKK